MTAILAAARPAAAECAERRRRRGRTMSRTMIHRRLCDFSPASTPRTSFVSFGSAALAVAMIVGDVGRLQGVGQAHVGDDREAEDLQPGVDGDDDLGHRGHADDIGPDQPQEAVFGPRFQVRARRPRRRRRGAPRCSRCGRLAAPARSASRSYGSHMSGKRGPRRSSLMPMSGLSPIRLMWSSMSMMSPPR